MTENFQVIGSKETELAIIASYLRNPEDLPEIMAALNPDDFVFPITRDLFFASKILYERQIPVNHLSLSAHLNLKEEKIPLSKIIEIEDMFFDGNFNYCVQKVKELSQRRQVQAILEFAKDPSIDLSNIFQKLDEVRGKSNDIGTSKIKLPFLSDYAKLDIKTEWAVENLIVANQINAIIGKFGLGKTTLVHQLGSCVSLREPFLELETMAMPVIILDYENSLPTICDRGRLFKNGRVRIWDLSNPVSPPMLDSKRWAILKNFEPCMLIFDTFRSSHKLKYTGTDEGMVSLFGRLKELRGLGFTIILLIHTTKANDATYKGPSDIPEQVDHIISLDRVQEIGSDRIDEDDTRVDLPLRLGFRMKTRFKPTPPIYLKFDPMKGFSRAENPEDLALPELSRILEDYCADKGNFPNQTAFLEAVKISLQIKPRQFRRMLERGNGKFWETKKGPRNAWIYSPASKDSVLHKTEQSKDSQDKEKTKFFSFTEPSKQIEKQDEIQFFKKHTLSKGECFIETLENSDLPEGIEDFNAQDEDLPF